MKRRFGAMLCASAMALTMLGGCGSSNERDNQFVVGMEVGYAPFNWQTNEETETSVSLGGAGYADGYDVMIAKILPISWAKNWSSRRSHGTA